MLCSLDSQDEIDVNMTMNNCLRLELDWFTWQWLKNVFTEYYFFVSIRGIVTIVGLTGSKSQARIFEIAYYCIKFLFEAGQGIFIYIRVRLNYILGTLLDRDATHNDEYVGNEIKKNYKLFFGSCAIMNFILASLLMGGLAAYNKIVIHSERANLGSYSTFIIITFFLYPFIPFVNGIMRTLNYKYFMIIYHTIVSLNALLFACYFFAIKKFNDTRVGLEIYEGSELKYIFVIIAIELTLRIIVYSIMIFIRKWNNKNHLYKPLASELVKR